MSRENQIEEVVELLWHFPKALYLNCYNDCAEVAELLYQEGYRKQSKGVWVKHLDEYDCEYAKCSCCGEEFYDASGEDTIDMFYKFCPNCGAKMKGGAE